MELIVKVGVGDWQEMFQLAESQQRRSAQGIWTPMWSTSGQLDAFKKQYSTE